MSTIYGIDVSKYQGVVDWNKVKAAGKEFVMVRAGTCGTDGGIQDANRVDSYFQANMSGALAAGLKVGVYVYSYAATKEAGQKAAKQVLELVKPYKLEYPIAFDIEDSMYLKKTKADNTAITDAFLSEIEKAGYYGLLYTYKSFAETNLDMASLSAYDVWIAQFASKVTYKGSYGMWQYSDTGTVNGINGACDLDVAYKDYASIISLAGLNNSEATTDNGMTLEEAEARIADLEDAINRIKNYVNQF